MPRPRALAQLGVARPGRCRAPAWLPPGDPWTRAAFRRLLDLRLPRLGREPRTTRGSRRHRRLSGRSELAGGAVPDCGRRGDLRGHPPSLCWVHDGRHYTKLLPQFACHRKALERFRKRYWDYYRELLAYRDAPAPRGSTRLEAAFDRLFGRRRAGWTCSPASPHPGEQRKLLQVLGHPSCRCTTTRRS